MKIESASSRIAFFVGFGFLLVSNAFADFSGQFVVTNWTISTQAFGCGASSVDTSGAPASVALSTGSGCASIGASFTFPSAPSAGVVAFSYAYSAGGDGPSDYPVSYVVNGTPTQFSNNAGTTSQSGNLTFSVEPGQSFGFLFQAANSAGQPDSLTISNFSFTSTNYSVGCGPTKLADLMTAMNFASGNSYPSSVTLSPGCVYTESGDIASTAPDGSPTLFEPIDNSVTVVGNGATIARDTATGSSRFFYVGTTGSLSLENLTLKNGISNGQNGGDAQANGTPGAGGAYSGLGGAIYNAGNLVVDAVTFNGNQAIGGNGGLGSNGSAGGAGGGGLGGAIFNTGSFNIQRSAFVANSADGGAIGGQTGCLDSNCYSNAGGGGGQGGVGGGYTPTGSAAGNGGYAGGGGGTAFGSHPGSTGGFAGGGGGGFSSGGAGGEFGGNGGVNGFSGGGGAGLGGAVFIEATTDNASRIVASTFSGNMAVAGGGAAGGDGGSGAGGAIFLHTGDLTLSFSTLVANGAAGGSVQPANSQNGGNGLGGGIYVHSAAMLTIDHTVVSGNSVIAGTTTNGSNGSAIDADLFGAMSSSGYNLVTTRGDSTGYVGSDLPNSESPNLGSLQNNGGPTQTYLPQPGSPLIDADTSANCSGGFATDQRGDPRPFGVGCDIGAVEVNDIIFRNGFELFD